MPDDEERPIEKRKDEHIRICLEKEPVARENLLDAMEIVHDPLPEVDWAELDVSTRFLGADMEGPIIIAGMTGGGDEAERLNKNLANAAEECGIAMGLGSQRPALEDPDLTPGYSLVRKYDIPLVMGNIGLPQLLVKYREEGKEGIREMFRRLIDMTGSDVICIHLNYLQEVVQPEGDLIARGGSEVIRTLAEDFTVVVKETGGGIGADTAAALKESNVAALDVGGRGGTTFSGVEYYRAMWDDETTHNTGKMLWDWGIPTPVAVKECAGQLPLVATGGVRNGLDIFKLLSLGADVVGVARVLLKPASEGPGQAVRRIRELTRELKAVMFLTGSSSLSDIPKVKKIFHRPLTDWLRV